MIFPPYSRDPGSSMNPANVQPLAACQRLGCVNAVLFNGFRGPALRPFVVGMLATLAGYRPGTAAALGRESPFAFCTEAVVASVAG